MEAKELEFETSLPEQYRLDIFPSYHDDTLVFILRSVNRQSTRWHLNREYPMQLNPIAMYKLPSEAFINLTFESKSKLLHQLFDGYIDYASTE